MRIVWRARARADINAMVAYVAQHNATAAFRMHDEITQAVGRLSMWPDIGRESRQPGLRELVVPRTPYLVLYRRTPTEVVILRVLHGRQNA